MRKPIYTQDDYVAYYTSSNSLIIVQWNTLKVEKLEKVLFFLRNYCSTRRKVSILYHF